MHNQDPFGHQLNLLQGFSDEIDSLLNKSKKSTTATSEYPNRSHQKTTQHYPPQNEQERYRYDYPKSKQVEDLTFLSKKPSFNKENHILGNNQQFRHHGSYSVKASTDNKIGGRGLSPDLLRNRQENPIFQEISSEVFAPRNLQCQLENDTTPDNIDVESIGYADSVNMLEQYIKKQEDFCKIFLDFELTYYNR